MSRDPYRGGRDDFGYGGGRGGGGSNRWDSERFAAERRGGNSSRFDSDRDFYEERDTRVATRGGGGRPRERSVDEIYERRGSRFEDDRFERRHYHDDDEPRYERERERPWQRDGGERTNITIEKERVYSPSPPRRGGNRPSFLRRQSSLDTFDRKPLTRFVEREEYGPPSRYRQPDFRPPALTPIPLPKSRQLGPPPRRYAERDYEDIRVAEPDFYGDDEYRGYPERVREREIIRRRTRSRSRDGRSQRGSVRSDSISSASSSDRETVRNEFPKKGKTRMPARLVSKKAIIDLGYPFEEEGDTIIIMKALGRENIDEVIKLSEDYKGDNDHITETEHTTYLVGPGADTSGGRSVGGETVFEERKTEQVFTVPPPPPPAGWGAPPPPPGWVPGPPPPAPYQEVVTDTKITESHNHHNAPIIVDAPRPHHHHHDTIIEQSTHIERSDPIPVGPLALAALPDRRKDERSIRAEIRALEAEKEALRAEKRADKELRKAHRIRGGSRVSENEMVLYDHERNEDVTIIKRERVEEADGGVRIEKDKKGRMAISVPKYIR